MGEHRFGGGRTQASPGKGHEKGYIFYGCLFSHPRTANVLIGMSMWAHDKTKRVPGESAPRGGKAERSGLAEGKSGYARRGED